MFKDKKMEKMMFTTGNIYRETGMISQRERPPWRVKWGQRGAAASICLSILFYVLNNVFFGNHNAALFVVTLLCFFGFVIGLGTLYFKNFSFVIARRLLREVNVVMILVLGISIFIIDCVKSYNSFCPINGFIYLAGTTLFVFLDAVKKKSRVLVLIIGIVFSLLTMYNIYTLTFTGTDTGVILFQYGDDYVFRKRSIKRSCFIQIFLFSLNGLWTMFKDKKMEKMMFATGHIYRETGTASKYVEDREHSERMRIETVESYLCK